jgi:hypothetical protein
LISTLLTLKFVYYTRTYLDGKWAILISVSDGIGILAYEIARGN